MSTACAESWPEECATEGTEKKDNCPKTPCLRVLRGEYCGARELHAVTMRKVDHGNLSFWAAARNKDPGLGRMERQRVKVWLRRAYGQLDVAGKHLFARVEQVEDDAVYQDSLSKREDASYRPIS